MGAPTDPPRIEVPLDDAGRGDEVRVACHGAGHPVDVRRLEGRDLAERVAVELAELDDVLTRPIEGRWLRTSEVPDPPALERPCRGRRTRRLVASALGTQRRLTSTPITRLGIRTTGRPRDGLIAWSVRRGRVDPAGNGTRGSRPWRTTATAADTAEVGTGSTPRLCRLEVPDQRRIRVVDLGHLPGGDPRSGRIVAGQVRMMRPSELPPGSLDLRSIRVSSDAEHLARIPSGHTRSVPMGARRTGYDPERLTATA